MSARIAGIAVAGRAKDVMTKVGQIGVVSEGSYKGDILLRHFSGYVSLTNPKNTWDTFCALHVETQPVGTVVTYTSEA